MIIDVPKTLYLFSASNLGVYHFKFYDVFTLNLCSSKSAKKSESDIFASSRLLTAGELRRQKALKKRQERKRGFCECCRVQYEDLYKVFTVIHIIKFCSKHVIKFINLQVRQNPGCTAIEDG